LTWAAPRAGLILVDVGIDSALDLDPPAPRSIALDDLPVRHARREDLQLLHGIAADAFVWSRFAVDPFFSAEQVADFYKTWLTNLYYGLAQAVLVYEIDGEPAGFISCAVRQDEGRIPLIATRASN